MISSPDSPHHQRLSKEDEDEVIPAEDEDDGLLGGGPLTYSDWRRKLLRRLSLALAIYGAVVMVTCLITNTFFIVAH